jgi:hypothetical protein
MGLASSTKTGEQSPDWSALMKVDVVRRVCEQVPGLIKKPNGEVREIVRKHAGITVTLPTIIAAIGRERSRKKAEPAKAVALLNKLMAVCDYDENIARSAFKSFMRRYREAKTQPVVSKG